MTHATRTTHPARSAHRKLTAGAALAVVLAVLTVPAPTALADPGSTSSATSSVDQLRRQAQQLRANLDQLAIEQDLAVERYGQAQEALLQATTGEVAAQAAVLDTERFALVAQDAAARRMRALYQSGGPLGLTASVLGSGSLSDLMVRWHAVEAIVRTDDEVTAQRRDAARQERRTAHEVALDRARAVAAQDAADRAASAVTASIARQQRLLASTDAKVVQLAEQQRVEQEAAALAAASQQATQLGIGGVTDSAGRGLEGSTAGSHQLPDVPAPNGVAAAAITAAATRMGMPYVWGATGPTTFDCSGLMLWAYAQAGVRIPRTSRSQYAGLPHVPLSDLAPGDLIFYATNLSNPGSIHHVGMYVGNGLSLYAPRTGSFVKIGAVGYGRIIGAARPTLGR